MALHKFWQRDRLVSSDLKTIPVRTPVELGNFWTMNADTQEKDQAHNLKVAGSNPAPATSSDGDFNPRADSVIGLSAVTYRSDSNLPKDLALH
jgi:hypothetical protein